MPDEIRGETSRSIGRTNPRSVVLPAVITALFSSHAMDIGKLIIVAKDCIKQACESSAEYQVEAGLLVLGVGFLILLVRGARQAILTRDEDASEGVAVSIVVGLVGGAFSIYDKTAKNGVPQPDTGEGLFFLVIMALIFVPPLWFVPMRGNGSQHFATLCQRLGLAAICALALTAGLMLIYALLGELFKFFSIENEGYLRLGGTSYFLSAPAAATLFSPWAMLAVDPVLRSERWPNWRPSGRWMWLAIYVFGAILFSAGYAYFSYFQQHGVPDHGWMRLPPGDALDVAFTIMAFAALHGPALGGAILLALLIKPENGKARISRKDAVPLLAVGAVAAIFAAFVGYSIEGRAGMTGLKVILFIIAHALTATATAAAVLVAYRWGLKSERTDPGR